MKYSKHGGGCCGVRHLHNMTVFDPKSFENIITSPYSSGDSPPYNGLIEVILNEYQCRAAPWMLKALEYAGFALVNTFYNSNSGNYCYVFHRVDTVRLIKNLPFEWNGPIGSSMNDPSLIEKNGEIASLPSRKAYSKGKRIEITFDIPNGEIPSGCTGVCTNPNNKHFYKKGTVSTYEYEGSTLVYVLEDIDGKTFKVSYPDLKVVLNLPAKKQTYS